MVSELEIRTQVAAELELRGHDGAARSVRLSIPVEVLTPAEQTWLTTGRRRAKELLSLLGGVSRSPAAADLLQMLDDLDGPQDSDMR